MNAIYRHIPISSLDGDALLALSKKHKLGLFREDILAVQAYYKDMGREPTDVELEVIAQTWSEHCKHRIFGALITHETDQGTEMIDGLFKGWIRATSERIFASKPGFVLGAFVDNAGFIKLDETRAACLKVETHNHPSAIEPYAGANTGLGGVIRDILGAGKGAKPVASLDVFCFGSPDTKPEAIKARDVIHPLGIMRGVVRGVRDYGNRMGIPTVNGAIQFDPSYIYNPLVFCGTAGIIPTADINKEMRAGLQIVAVGARTGRDGLKGATFSSASLGTASHEEDQSAVQIGNPIEEKKAADFILQARAEGLIVFVTDCGAGGFSSAAGEMLSETGGELFLERAPLKAAGMESWQIFLSESQERMVLAVEEKDIARLREIAGMFETELTVLGHSDGTGVLKVWHHGEKVVELDCSRLHEAPRRKLNASWKSTPTGSTAAPLPDFTKDAGQTLRALLSDFAIVSREPIIREYDHQVQGNTVLTPLAGAAGDAPQDGAVVRVDGCEKLIALGCSLLPEWGKYDPHRMGKAVVDECFRQLVAVGSDPEQIAILDNFCLGNPDDARELGALVECVKGMCEAAEVYGAPFISGKDSFYNYFQTDEGPISIPVTALVSGLGIVPEQKHVIGSSLRRTDSVICLLGQTDNTSLGGSVYARQKSLLGTVPDTDLAKNLSLYRRYASAVAQGLILSCHDVGEGGLAVTLAELAFSDKAGLDIETSDHLFAESSGRFVIEVAKDQLGAAQAHFGSDLTVLGHATAAHRQLIVKNKGSTLINEPLAELKALWKGGLVAWY